MKYYYYGAQNADTVLIQMVGEHDLPLMEQEYAHIRKLVAENTTVRETIIRDEPAPGMTVMKTLSPEKNIREIRLTAVLVDDWNEELSPWNAPGVFGKDRFGDGAAETLRWLQDELIPALQDVSRKTIYIGGYSLAGLFALWATYQTDLFAGTAAVSPSVWFPNFREYVCTQEIRTRKVYLSLGDKEEKTRNQVMAQVGSAIRDIYHHLQENGISCTLEWNAGNHFAEPDLRMAKGWAWLLNR